MLGEALARLLPTVADASDQLDQSRDLELGPRSESRPKSGQLAVPVSESRTGLEAGLENGLDLRAPRTVGVLLLQFLATLEVSPD